VKEAKHLPYRELLGVCSYPASCTKLEIGPDHEPENPKNLEAFILETFLDAKPGRVSVRLLTNEIMRVRCIAPIIQRDNSEYKNIM
jgi:hypothetical protein